MRLEYKAVCVVAALVLSGCAGAGNSVAISGPDRGSGFDPSKDLKLYADASSGETNVGETWRGFRMMNSTLKGMLRRISLAENKNYVYMGRDLRLPDAPNLYITGFEDLRRYVRDATPYALVVKKNGFVKSDTVLVDLYYRKSNPFLEPFNVDIIGEGSLAKIFERIGAVTGYSVYVDSDLDEEFNCKPERFAFHGKTMMDFLKYVEKAKNVFVDVNFDKKTIEVSRYRTDIIELPVYSRKDTTDLVLASPKGYSRTEAVSDPYSDLKNYISSFLGDKCVFFVDSTLNRLVVKTDRRHYVEVMRGIDDYVSVMSIPIRISVRIYDVKVPTAYMFDRIRSDLENRNVWISKDFDLNVRAFASRYGKVTERGTLSSSTFAGMPVAFDIDGKFMKINPKPLLSEGAVSVELYSPFSSATGVYKLRSGSDLVVTGSYIKDLTQRFLVVKVDTPIPNYRRYLSPKDRVFK